MVFDCSDIPGHIVYDCSNPWGQGCTSSQHFNFATLWNYTRIFQNTCATDERLFGVGDGPTTLQKAALTMAACTAIAGGSWTYYPAADIWTRLTTWKFPLLQMVASFARPPLSFWVEMFVTNHLLGDPIDTFKNLLGKMSECQMSSKYWRSRCEVSLRASLGDKIDHHWKALAIITDAYAEYGLKNVAEETL